MTTTTTRTHAPRLDMQDDPYVCNHASYVDTEGNPIRYDPFPTWVGCYYYGYNGYADVENGDYCRIGEEA